MMMSLKHEEFSISITVNHALSRIIASQMSTIEKENKLWGIKLHERHDQIQNRAHRTYAYSCSWWR